MEPPVCGELEILAFQQSCYICVNPATCRPWGIPGCERDAECDIIDYCNPCGTSSCPYCEDCVPACTPHGCPTETVLTCLMERPDCEDDGVAVVEDGCWLCVDLGSCQ